MVRPGETQSGLKEQQVRALREARFAKRKMLRVGSVVTQDAEIEMLRAEVKRLKRELAKAHKHG